MGHYTFLSLQKEHYSSFPLCGMFWPSMTLPLVILVSIIELLIKAELYPSFRFYHQQSNVYQYYSNFILFKRAYFFSFLYLYIWHLKNDNTISEGIIDKILRKRTNMHQIAIEGCCHGQLDNIYNAIKHDELATGKKVDLVLICGDFQVNHLTIAAYAHTHIYIERKSDRLT